MTVPDAEISKTHECFAVCWLIEDTGLKFPMLSRECQIYGAVLDDWCNGPYERKPSLRGHFTSDHRIVMDKCLTCGQRKSRRHRTYNFSAPHLLECRCQGRGRVPVDTFEAWLAAADTLGAWAMENKENGQHWFLSDYYNQDGELCATTAPTVLAAVQEALCKVTGQHWEETND